MDYDKPPAGGHCLGKPTEWWFPYYHLKYAHEVKAIRRKAAEAKQICHSCPVRVHCLEYSLRHEPWGIWGGEDESTRTYIRMERNIEISREGIVTVSGVGSMSANGTMLRKRLARKAERGGR